MSTRTASIRDVTCVADALELGRLKDGTSDTDPESLRKLYRHCRNDDGKRVMFEQDSTFVGKWINLDLPAAKEIIAVFVPLDDESDLKKARKIARMNLEAVPWNDILRIPSPGIRLRIKIHGRRWGMRFESGEPALRGRQTINEQLPPIPSDAPADRIPDGVPTADTPSPAPTDIPVTHSEATDVLRSAGMPS